MNPELSIIIISYNTRDITLACLASVLGETKDTTYDVIVVDNASKDGSAAAVAEKYPAVTVIALDENIGFARGNNRAAESACGKYLLLLNPDTVVLDGAIDRLMEVARAKPDARIWGGRTVNADRTLNPASCWRRMTLWSVFCSTSGLSLLGSSPLFARESYGGWLRDTEREVDIVTGCFLLTTRDFWSQLGGFDPAYFMYGEEADLCLRARKLGARPMVTPTATIVHYNSPADPMRPDKIVGILKAKMTLIRRHWPRGLRTVGCVLFGLGPFTRRVGYAIAASVKGPNVRKTAETWREVWQRRAEWRKGYSGVRSS